MHRISLGNTEFEGRNNAYLLLGEDSTAIVDTGVATPSTREQLEDGLAEHGVTFSDIDAVVLTHWHADHVGLASAIRDAGGATVYIHEADAPIVRQDPAALEELRDIQERRFDEWDMPEDKRAELLNRLDMGFAIAGDPVEVDTVTEGDRLEVGGRQLEVVHAPGHTSGLSLFAFDGEAGREAFVGDAVLPVYTPNVGGADLRVEQPLATYLETLHRLESADYDRFWPGHRDVIDEPTERVRTIIEHHRDRTERVIEVLAEHGPANAWTVSDHLFGELNGIHILHGPGESFAHIDHLITHGIVESTPEGFRLVEDADARIADLV